MVLHCLHPYSQTVNISSLNLRCQAHVVHVAQSGCIILDAHPDQGQAPQGGTLTFVKSHQLLILFYYYSAQILDIASANISAVLHAEADCEDTSHLRFVFMCACLHIPSVLLLVVDQDTQKHCKTARAISAHKRAKYAALRTLTFLVTHYNNIYSQRCGRPLHAVARGTRCVPLSPFLSAQHPASATAFLPQPALPRMPS